MGLINNLFYKLFIYLKQFLQFLFGQQTHTGEIETFQQYKDLKFVKDVSKFCCNYCKGVAFVPYVSAKDKIYCNKCRLKYEKSKHIKMLQDKDLQSELHSMKVKCPNKKFGCSRKVALKEITKHLEMCQVETIQNEKINYGGKPRKSKDDDTQSKSKKDSSGKSKSPKGKTSKSKSGSSFSESETSSSDDEGKKANKEKSKSIDSKRKPKRYKSNNDLSDDAKRTKHNKKKLQKSESSSDSSSSDSSSDNSSTNSSDLSSNNKKEKSNKSPKPKHKKNKNSSDDESQLKKSKNKLLKPKKKSKSDDVKSEELEPKCEDGSADEKQKSKIEKGHKSRNKDNIDKNNDNIDKNNDNIDKNNDNIDKNNDNIDKNKNKSRTSDKNGSKKDKTNKLTDKRNEKPIEEIIEIDESKNSVKPSDVETKTLLCQELKFKAVPGKHYNILLLGQTGVGKSTFINSFRNYLHFESLAVARDGEPQVLIACNFSLPDENFEQRTITFGEDANENLGAQGQSATQNCKSYEFAIENFHLRIFDTPGIGDTRGVEQDKLNLSGMMEFLKQYDELHAICILLKPNEARLTPSFSFCIKQLLCQLHQSAKENIVFVFTNSRGTFYRPGDTVKPLQEILNQVKNAPPHPVVPFGINNIFCLDNEAFRFLVALKNNINFDGNAFNNFEQSWVKSVDESSRLIKYIVEGVEGKGLNPHYIKESLCVNTAKDIILNLSQPLSEIAKTVQQNLQLLNERKQEIDRCKNDKNGLMKLLHLPCVTLDIKELDQPRTVCTGEKCRELYKVGSLDAFHYPKKCHDPCYLKDIVEAEIVGDEPLRNCYAFDKKTGICKQCNCSYKKHLHIYYESETKQIEVIDENIQKQLHSKEGILQAKNEFVMQLEDEITKYETERDNLAKYTAQLAIYLKQNAMVVVNDSYEEYLKVLIENERSLNHNGSNNEAVLKGLKGMLSSYKEEKRILSIAMEGSSQKHEKVAVEDVERIINEISSMITIGTVFQKVFQAQTKTGIFGHIGNLVSGVKKAVTGK